MSDEKMRELWRRHGGYFHGPLVETGCMREDKLLPFLREMTNAAQTAERIKELEQQNEQLQAQVAMLTDASRDYMDNLSQHVTRFGKKSTLYLSESKLREVLSATTKTAEAYKRRVQAEAVKKFIENFSFEDAMNQYRCQYCNDDDGVALPLPDALCAVGMSFNNAQCEVELLADYVGGAMLDELRRMASELLKEGELI